MRLHIIFAVAVVAAAGLLALATNYRASSTDAATTQAMAEELAMERNRLTTCADTEYRNCVIPVALRIVSLSDELAMLASGEK
jgi:hypothetical protein